MLQFLGKTVIKSKIKGQIEDGKQKFNEHGTIFTKLINSECVTKFPDLQKALTELKAKEEEFSKLLVSDKILDPVVKIVCTHLKELTAKDFQEKITANQSVLNIVEFATHLIDIKHYTTLSELLADAEKIDKLPTAKQMAIMTSLNDGKLLSLIKGENDNLNIDIIKKTFENKAAPLLNDILKLDVKEKADLIQIYNELTNKYVPIFNSIRLELLKDLPELLKMEFARAQNLCPHLVIQQNAQSQQKSITTRFKDTIKEPEPKQSSIPVSTQVQQNDAVDEKAKDEKTKKAVNF